MQASSHRRLLMLCAAAPLLAVLLSVPLVSGQAVMGAAVEGFEAAVIEQLFLLDIRMALVGQDDADAGIEEGQLAQAARQDVEAELGDAEDGGVADAADRQRLQLAAACLHKPEVLILDEPTRGIDVGAKYEIYTIIAQLAAEGKCVLMISSEMPELLGMCDRICVLNEGAFVAEFPAAEATQEKIMRSIVTSGVN